MRSRVLAFFALLLTLVGLGASIASLFDYLAPVPTFCAEDGCATVRQSAWAAPLGIPLPAIGIAYFTLMSVLAFLPRKRLRVALAVLGGVVGVSLILMQAFAIGAWCKLCLVADPAAIAHALVVVAGAGTVRVTWPNIAATVPAAGLVVLGLGLWADAGAQATAKNAPLPECVEKEQRPDVVTIVEFVDFECPFCRAMDKKLTAALEQTNAQVRIVRKMVPLPSHTYAVPAAMAWVCADEQGKGDAMAKELFAAEPETLTPAGCEAIAARLGCDITKYRATFASMLVRERVERDMADAKQAELKGLPTIFIGRQRFDGSDYSIEHLREAIGRAKR